jgi:hypothetical protein
MMADLAALLARVDAAVAEKAPTCRACGRCCRFAEFGHRLYVSTGELALLTSHPAPHASRPGLCPCQDGAECTARDGRALGCRVFFCDAGLTAWSNALYERFHAEIRRLHERHGVEYFYVDLTAGVAETCSIL